MTDTNDQSTTSGVEDASSGAEDQKPVESSSADLTGLANTNFEKVLKEKKNYALKVKELEAELKKSREEKMVQSQQWKELAEQREQELLDTKASLEAKEKKIQEASVNGALRNELLKYGMNTQLVDYALRIIDKNGVQVDFETGVVLGANEVVKDFHKTFAGQSFFSTPQPRASQTAPSFNSGLTGEDAFKAELRNAKTQKELEAVMRKHNKLQ